MAGDPEQPDRERLSTRDKLVAGFIALMLILITLAIFRLGIARLF